MLLQSPIAIGTTCQIRLDICTGLSRNDRYYITAEGLCEQIAQFLEFGRMMQTLAEELCRSRKTAAEQQLLKDCSQAMAAAELASEAEWWAA